MSRAAQNQYQTDQAQTTNLQNQLLNTAGNIQGQASQIQNLSPAAQAAYIAQNTSGTAAAFGQGQQRAKDTAARTGSLAGLQEVNANLTRGQAEQNAQNTQKAQQYFQNYNNQAAQERANVYAQGAQAQEGALQSNTQLQSALTNTAYAPGLFSNILTGLASGAGAAAAKFI